MVIVLEKRVELGLRVPSVLISKMVCFLLSVHLLFEFPLKLSCPREGWKGLKLVPVHIQKTGKMQYY